MPAKSQRKNENRGRITSKRPRTQEKEKAEQAPAPHNARGDIGSKRAGKGTE